MTTKEMIDDMHGSALVEAVFTYNVTHIDRQAL